MSKWKTGFQNPDGELNGSVYFECDVLHQANGADFHTSVPCGEVSVAGEER